MLHLHRMTCVPIIAVSAMALGPGIVSGQDYPSKPIRIVAGAAGGGGDWVARYLAQGISGPLGQPVIVENRGSAVLSADTVAKAPPDGYTALVQGASLWVVGLLQKMPYDVVRDFSPITMVSKEAFLVAVHPSLPVKSIKELIALAKAKPGQLNYASGTTGGPPHLGAELIKSMAGVNIVRVAYKGTAPAVTGVLTGESELTVADLALLLPHVKSGKIRGVAVTSSAPSELAPGVPTVAATGLPGFELVGGSGIWAPAKTPAAVINRLNQEIGRLLNTAETKERFLGFQIEVEGGTPAQFDARIKSDIVKWTKVIKDAGIKVN